MSTQNTNPIEPNLQQARRKSGMAHEILIKFKESGISEELDDKIKIVKIDVDNNNQTAMKYSIRSIPTLMVIKDGIVQGQHIGAASKAQIQQFINENI